MNYILSADIAGLSMAVTFLVIFTIRKRNSRTRYILIAIMLISIVFYLFDIFVITGHWEISKLLSIIVFPLMFAFYPVLNVYISTFTSSGNKLSVNIKTFFLPLLVCISVITTLIFLKESEFILLISAGSSYKPQLLGKLNVFFWILYTSYYVQFIYFLKKFIGVYKKLKNDIKYSFMSIWIKYIIVGILSYEVIFFIAWSLKDDILFLDSALGTLFILFLGIIGLKLDEILLEIHLSNIFKNTNLIETSRKIKSKIDTGLQDEMIKEMRKIIEQEKLYLNPSLTIKSFAKRLHIPERELSIIINEKSGKNFSAFVNQFRIQEACNLISIKEMKISDISLHVGFFSRAAFTNTFKEFTGLTPTEYRQTL